MSISAQSTAIVRERKALKVCVLDGDPSQMILTMELLNRAGYPALGTARPDEALERVHFGAYRVILADCSQVGIDGVAFLDKALRQDPPMYVILMSASHSVDSAIEAIKHGSFDYLCKPLDYPRLTQSLDDLAAHIQHGERSAMASGQDWQPLPLREMRRIHIHRVLDTCNGNRVRAARVLGIGRTSLYRFLKSADKRATARASA
jgi:DNA-binding NtrC family response regulator